MQQRNREAAFFVHEFAVKQLTVEREHSFVSKMWNTWSSSASFCLVIGCNSRYERSYVTLVFCLSTRWSRLTFGFTLQLSNFFSFLFFFFPSPFLHFFRNISKTFRNESRNNEEGYFSSFGVIESRPISFLFYRSSQRFEFPYPRITTAIDLFVDWRPFAGIARASSRTIRPAAYTRVHMHALYTRGSRVTHRAFREKTGMSILYTLRVTRCIQELLLLYFHSSLVVYSNQTLCRVCQPVFCLPRAATDSRRFRDRARPVKR